ncbi:MAG TPA: sulfurtransferase/chromate resistance protein [Thermohalobaculum sp.]|nr:sulfurtransferase/chromate resistance protein [Thermohalobaculum sp.]
MPSPTEITVAQLQRLVGLPGAPPVVDVRTDEDFALDPRLIPGARRADPHRAGEWGPALAGGRAVVVCQKGLKLSQGAAALLRNEGVAAETLAGGTDAWRAAGAPTVAAAAISGRDARGRTVWVTRARPKIDRIACPWLIRRWVDPDAVILYVAPSEVAAVAERFAATAFDIDGAALGHRGERCTFDAMLDAFGLEGAPLRHLAQIVRGADTARPDLAPEAPGLLAVSLGLSRMHRDDLAQLDAAMALYDALYRWCRDATGETHGPEAA